MTYKDPDGWTVENNPHPAPDYIRLYPDKNGEHWTDYMEYYGSGKMICHSCIKRSQSNSGNCRDGGEYFICVKNGQREKLRKNYEKKKGCSNQTNLNMEMRNFYDSCVDIKKIIKWIYILFQVK